MSKEKGEQRLSGYMFWVLLLLAVGAVWLVSIFLRWGGPRYGSPAWVVERTLAAQAGLTQATEELARYYKKPKNQIEQMLQRINEAQKRSGITTRFIRWEISSVHITQKNEASVNVLVDILMRYGKGEAVPQRLNLLYRLRKENGKWRIVR